MIKKGFTLAEVLVTLGIIGIVAALTMPSLGKSASRAKIGPELAAAIRTVENATQQFMADYNANYLSVALKKSGETGKLDEYLAYLVENGYIKAEKSTDIPKESTAYSSYTEGEGASATTSTVGLKTSGTGYVFANKSAIAYNDSCSFVEVKNEEGTVTTEKQDKCEVLFMTSGFKNRDTLITGLDIFRFYLTNDGTVDVGNSTNCGDGKSGFDCAGKIAQDGWKVTY